MRMCTLLFALVTPGATDVSARTDLLGLEKLTRVPPYDRPECPCCGLLGCFLCLLGVRGAESGCWGVLESVMKLRPCLAESILALRLHERTPPLSPDPVLGCFHLSSQPRTPAHDAVEPGSAAGPDAADSPQAMRRGKGRWRSAASDLAEATVTAVTSDDPEAVLVPREGVAVHVATHTQR